MSTTNVQTTVTLTIDGQTITVPKGTTVYTAICQLGIDVPIFCYQDRMPPFGACRVCLVEVEKMGKLQTSCTLEATEGMVVKTQSESAVKGREGILEFLLINHPLDCPICDRGGECPLQDQTIKFGPGLSRFYEEKRHFTKAYPLGPVLMLDRERCIVCARCTRFGDIIAGDHALEFIERGYKTEVGTPDGGPAESKFIGNTIMICPVGALTSDVYRFRARPWDNDSQDTTCTLCPVGCSMILDTRDGEIVRTRSKENRDVNDIWLCDKGWFGYEFSSSDERLQKPLIRRNGRLEETSYEEAISYVASKIQEFKGNGKLAGLGGNPLTVEDNYFFQKLMREGASVNHLDHRIGVPLLNLEEEAIEPGMEISIGECENLSFAYLLGIDLTEEFPVIWLRLKQAINKGAKVIFMGHYAPEISPHLNQTLLHAPGHEIEMINKLAKESGKGAIFVGRQYLASKSRSEILAKLTEFTHQCGNVTLNILEGQGNSVGARFAGMRPDLGTLGTPIKNPGKNAHEVIQSAAESGWDFLYVAGANLATKYPSQLWNEARKKLKCLVVQDIFLTETAKQADVVFPTLSYVEKEGTFINIEKRLQTVMPAKDVPITLLGDGEIFNRIAKKLHIPFGLDPEFLAALAAVRLPIKRSGKISAKGKGQKPSNKLLATFAPALFDRGVRMQHNTHLVQLAKFPYVRLHPEEGKKRHLSNGDIVKINHSIKGELKWDDKVAEGVVVLPLGFDELSVHELDLNLWNGLEIEIEKAK